MEKIYEFSGNKTISKLTEEDCDRIEKSLVDDYFEIPIFKKSDFIRARKEGCAIYYKTFKLEDCEVERYFIRISKTNVFRYANL